MRNRSYIGNGVYVSFTGTELCLELETRGKILLDERTWMALMTWMRATEHDFDSCRIFQIPAENFDQLSEELLQVEAELNKDAPKAGTKLQ